MTSGRASPVKFKISAIFGKSKSIIIGAVHFPPLLGYPDFPGFSVALRNALADAKTMIDGGVDGVIFENNYDLPHHIFVEPPVIAAMTHLGHHLKNTTKKPLGVNVLWNDFYSSLSLANVLGLKFVRVPVFVDKVKTDCGIIEGDPKAVLAFRKKIGAENVALFTDIHVKHSTLLSRHGLIASARLAIRNKSDALIITGNWTGQAPDLVELKALRAAIGNFPILVGSGANTENIGALLRYANGVIVSTSLKRGSNRKGEQNVKAYEQRIDPRKVREFIAAVRKSGRK